MEVKLGVPFKSKAKNKKYSVYVRADNERGYKIIHFGDSRYGQYKDSTGVGAYSHKDHGDLERKKRYYQRHSRNPAHDTPGYFSNKYLW